MNPFIHFFTLNKSGEKNADWVLPAM